MATGMIGAYSDNGSGCSLNTISNCHGMYAVCVDLIELQDIPILSEYLDR